MFGAGGETVGAIVADRLGAELVDAKFFEEIAHRLELPHEEAQELEESPDSFVGRLLSALGAASMEFAAPPEAAAWTPPYSEQPAADTRKAALQITQQVIREAARTGNAVIIGRGGRYVLEGAASALHIFVRASEDFRVQHLRQAYGWTDDQARRRLKQTDANRGAYVRQVYGHDWLHPAHYDLVVDTGRLGFERAARIIADAALSAS